MATHIKQSLLIALPIEDVWRSLRDFSFPAKLLDSSIASCKIVEGGSAFSVGAVRLLRWHTGEWRKHRLLSLSDMYFRVSWELIEASESFECDSMISSIQLVRVTEDNTTFVQWSADFSASVPASFVRFERASYKTNLQEIRNSLARVALPKLHHVHEGPSCRVLWLSRELALPLEVLRQTPSLRSSSLTEVPASQGGLLTCFQSPEVGEMVESGAVLLHLLERHDRHHRLSPHPASKYRAHFLQCMFFLAATMDPILMEAYKQENFFPSELTKSQVDERRVDFEQHVLPRLARLLDHHTFLCGEQFTAADIFCGWSLFVAEMLGWLDRAPPTIASYYQRLRLRPHFSFAFSDSESFVASG